MATAHTNTPQRDPVESACSIVCSAVADLGYAMGWHVRLRAAELLLVHLVGVAPRVQRVRSAVYGMSALHRLGGSVPLPESETELARLTDKVGPAMLLIGYDEPHAVLVVDDRILIELFSWSDHVDPGALMQPFAREIGKDAGSRFTIPDVASGGAAAYELLEGASLPPLNRMYEQMALQLARAAAPRVRWQLDAPRQLRERSA